MIDPGMKGDFLLLNNFDTFPDLPSAGLSPYDFQIIHIPLRSILGNAFFYLPEDGSRHEEFLRQIKFFFSKK